MTTKQAKTVRHLAALKAHRTRAEQALSRARNAQKRKALKAAIREYDRTIAQAA
jgi:hypothetical protein